METCLTLEVTAKLKAAKKRPKFNSLSVAFPAN